MLTMIFVTLLTLVDDASPLDGNWQNVSLEFNGVTYGEAKLQGVRIEIAGDQYIAHRGKVRRTGKIVNLGPQTIDVVVDKDGQVLKGIYRLEGDTLTICTVTRGDRPTDFSSGVRSANQVRVYRRVEAKP